MKGLYLCEKFYNEYGAGMIKEKFPQYQERIAAGLVGDGSECYGFDDEISKDHDWGPGFCMWLNIEDYKAIGSALQVEYDSLPKVFDGYERMTSQWGEGRTGVFEVGAFYSKFIGIPHVPESIERWLYLPENYLSVCTNGKIFVDPLGQFSQIRKELLDFYPEDVRLVKIAARCMSSAQSGQYNYLRSIRHKEYYAAQYAEVKFCNDIMSLVFLLNRCYAPFYKWRHRAVKDLPVLGEFIWKKIDEMVKTHDLKRKNSIIEEISAEVIDEFQKEGLSDSDSDFLLDHGPVIHGKIKNENLRKRNVWVG
ncbi:MAG: hypothetical protein B1H11_05380 [Desulfobacteraceae bacterium 4484_190.1]|nr:MAG: hypothetical protein B1H11_05380 [Desulfobacteraceae bacterium 4484_190.1]